jgi:ribosome-associated protein
VPDATALRVNRSLSIPLEELEWRAMASGGPGGQHANRSNTKVELRFDVESSPSLGPRQRARLLDKLGPLVRVTVDAERSQLRNRSIALERLAQRLADALHIDAPRRATAPTKAARARRLEAKRHQAERKRQRQPPRRDDG